MEILKRKRQRLVVMFGLQCLSLSPPPVLASELQLPVHPNLDAWLAIFFAGLIASASHHIHYELHQAD